uniref:Pentacotripeptide-repeat region of PRORP domain-containing protein n=1 Tax=Brassica oleracea TaxID=3712 RepID=A0A3P6G1V6_BRAOL|nr:unnamed protein product [Brassica oleracea]
MGFVPTMICTARGSLLSSTSKLRHPFSCDSLKPLGPLLRNLSTAAERLGSLNPNPTGTSSNQVDFVNRDQYLGGFQQNSYGQSLNPDYPPVSSLNPNGFYQSSELFDQRDRNWQSSSDACSSYGNYNQENAGFVHSPSQSWTSPPNQSDPQVQSHQDNSGYDSLDALCREGNVKEAVDIIKSWRNQGYLVDLPRLLWIAKLCGDAQALQEAKVVHEFITSSVSPADTSAYNSVIEMYSCCESVEDALSVFESMPEKNSQTWCIIIRCLAKNGHEEDAVDMFSRFKEEGNRPDGEIFKEVFFACGVLGDVNEGLLHFESMRRDYEIVPDMEHYVSVVKMLAEPGYLDEALRFIELFEPNAVDLWETLMNLARVHGDLDLGDKCQDMVEKLDASRLSKESKAGFVPANHQTQRKRSYRGYRRGITSGLEIYLFRKTENTTWR